MVLSRINREANLERIANVKRGGSQFGVGTGD